MNRLDRLYRKALQGVRSNEEREKIITTVEEIEEYIGMRKTKPLSEEEAAKLQFLNLKNYMVRQ